MFYFWKRGATWRRVEINEHTQPFTLPPVHIRRDCATDGHCYQDVPGRGVVCVRCGAVHPDNA